MTDIEDTIVLPEEKVSANEGDPDQRIPLQLWERKVTPNNEFEEGKSGHRNEFSGKKKIGHATRKEVPMEVENVTPETKSVV